MTADPRIDWVEGTFGWRYRPWLPDSIVSVRVDALRASADFELAGGRELRRRRRTAARRLAARECRIDGAAGQWKGYALAGAVIR